MNILIGVTGSVSAYKTCSLIRLLLKNPQNTVSCVMTQAAQKFVTKEQLSALGATVYTDEDEWSNTKDILHVKLASWCDIYLIYPCTANTLAKLVHNLCDNLVTCAFMALPPEKKMFVAPAMNVHMWTKAADLLMKTTFCDNIDAVLMPETGTLACGDYGDGKLKSPKQALLKMSKSCSCNDGELITPAMRKYLEQED